MSYRYDILSFRGFHNRVQNPFEKEKPTPSLIKAPTDEIEQVIENVNLTYRARTDAAVIASLEKEVFELSEHDIKLVLEFYYNLKLLTFVPRNC